MSGCGRKTASSKGAEPECSGADVMAEKTFLRRIEENDGKCFEWFGSCETPPPSTWMCSIIITLFFVTQSSKVRFFLLIPLPS